MPQALRSRALRAALALVATGTLAACDLPTEAPRWSTTWVIPAQQDSIAVTQFLPPSVSVEDSVFRVALDPVTTRLSLGELCPDCAPLHGVAVPKPAFEAIIRMAVALPADVGGLTLGANSAMQYRVLHDFGFDLMQPAAGSAGSIQTLFTSDGRTVSTDSVDGALFPLPANQPLDRLLGFTPEARLADSVEVLLTVQSPAGDVVTIDTAQALTVVATPVPLFVRDVDIALADYAVDGTSVELDLSDLADAAEQVEEAALDLTIDNPFAARADFMARFEADGVALIPAKTITILPGASTVRVTLTGAEIQQLMGRAVTVQFSGSLSATDPSGYLTVTPTQVLRLASEVRLSVLLPDAPTP